MSMGTQKCFQLTVNVSTYVCLSTYACQMNIFLVELSYLENLKTRILKIFSAGNNTEDKITSYIAGDYKTVYTIRGKFALPWPYSTDTPCCTQMHRRANDSNR